MREEPALASLPFRVRVEPKVLRLSLDLDIGPIMPADKALEVGVSAVVKTKGGETSHWALAHPGPRPDFHRRDGFTLSIAAYSRMRSLPKRWTKGAAPGTGK